MTEQEIVQALTLCAGNYECTSCPLFDPEDDDCACAVKMKRAAAALITEQRALLDAFAVGFTAVPPVKVGDTVYFLIEYDDFPELPPGIEAAKVTEVGTRGFFTSAVIPPQDDMGDFTPWSELGKTVFLREEDALPLLKRT